MRQYQYYGEEAQPEFNEDRSPDQGPGGGGYWSLIGDEYYIKDVSEKEIAVYHSSNLDHWNVWGSDNAGKINANGSKFFYIKDHLGSVRVVLNSDNQIVSAIDYDCWGYPLENRSYQSDDINYKFTGKQRDVETGYDYFGARYYDARIGRWGGVEPLLEKYISYSPYQYGLLNPMKFVDVDGLDLYVGGDKNTSLAYLQSLVSTEDASRITMNDDGKVSFNTDGLNVSDDAAYDLLNKMVNESKNNYLFEVGSTTEGYTRTLGSSERKQLTMLNVEEVSDDHNSGVYNLSKTQKMKNYIANDDYLPKNGFDGQITLGRGYWLTRDRKCLQPISNIVFHELDENYYRTEMGYYHADPANPNNGAHYKANKDSEKFKKQEGNPGEGSYVPFKY